MEHSTTGDAEPKRQSPLQPPGVPGRLPRLSAAALVGSNLIPLFGVLFLGWRVFPIMLVFSLENIVIGFFNVLRMIKAPCDRDELLHASDGSISSKAGLIFFFCFHYGGFVLGHLFFVVAFFGAAWPGTATWEQVSPGHYRILPDISRLIQEDWWALGAAFAGLWISHGISYVRNFIRGGEYNRVTTNKLFLRPYGRVLIMHVTIVFGGWLVMKMGSHAALIALLVLLKIVLDLAGHWWERMKFARAPAGAWAIDSEN